MQSMLGTLFPRSEFHQDLGLNGQCTPRGSASMSGGAGAGAGFINAIERLASVVHDVTLNRMEIVQESAGITPRPSVRKHPTR